MRQLALVSLVVIGLVASGCEDPDTNDYDPMGVAAAEAGLPLASEDAVESCIESTQADAFAGDPEAQELWNSVDQSEAALRRACIQLGVDDPDRLAQMHWNWTAAQSPTETPDQP